MTISNCEPLLWSTLSSPRTRRTRRTLRGGGWGGGAGGGTPANVRIDQLEQRSLLAAISFDGGGDGRNWFDPLNWSSDALPTAVDAVTISAAAGRAIRFDGAAQIASLRADAPIDFAAGSLSASGTLTFTARVTLAQQASITAGGTFTITRAQSSTSAESPGFGSSAWRDRIDLAGSITAPSIFVSAGLHGGLSITGSLTATGETRAGRIELLGERILVSAATVRADGPASGGDGGEILIGGNYQGRGPQQNALRTYIDTRSTVSASASTNGHGGRVIVWSDEATVLAGTILARATGANFNGGFVEVSSKGALGATGRVDTQGGEGGDNGTLLLDPRDITIFSDNGSGDGQLGDSQVLFGDLGAVDITIWSIFIATRLGNVILQAQRDIVFFPSPGSALNMANLGPGETLTLQAGRDVRVSQSITTAGGNVVIIAGDTGSPTLFPAGVAVVTAQIATSGGTVSIATVGTGSITGAGAINTGAGLITINSGGGVSLSGAITAAQVRINSRTTVSFSGSLNSIGTLAAVVTGIEAGLNIANNTSLVIGTVSGLSGITTNSGDALLIVNGVATISSPISLTEGALTLQAGNLSLTSTVSATTALIIAPTDVRLAVGDGAIGELRLSTFELTRFLVTTLNLAADQGVVNFASLDLVAEGYNLGVVANTNSIIYAGLTLAPNRTLRTTAGSTITQTGPIIAGTLNFDNNTGTITLDNTGNRFDLIRGTAISSGTSITSAGATSIGPITRTGLANPPLSITIVAPGASLNFGGTVNIGGGFFTLNVAGPITQTGGGVVASVFSVSGATTAVATLTAAANDVGSFISTYTGSFTFHDANALTTGSISGGQNVTIVTGGTLTVSTNASALASISLQSGASGTGNLNFIGPGGFFIQAPTIRLLAGDGAAGVNTAVINVGSVSFRRTGLGTSPTVFEFRQDAAISSATLPAATQFSGGLAGMDYTIDSDASSVVLNDSSKVALTLLRLRSATTSSFINPGSLTVAGLDVIGACIVDSSTPITTITATSAGMSFSGPVTFSTFEGVTFALSSNTPVFFGGPVDCNVLGSAALTIAGGVTTVAAIGATFPPRSLSVTGPATLGGNVTTRNSGGLPGLQSYSGPTLISSNIILTGSTIGFSNTLNATAGAPRALTIIASGSVTFSGAVGGTTPLGSLTTDTPAPVIINGGSVTTTGIQFYSNTAGPAALINVDSPTATTTFTAGSLNFGGLLRATAVGESIALSASANTFVRGAPGSGGINFVNITVNAGGTATFQAGATVTGALNITDTLVLNGDLGTTTFTAASISLGPVSSPLAGQTLALNSAGAKALNGTVGSAIARVGTLVLSGGGTTSIGASVFVASDFTLSSATTITGATTLDTLGNFANNAAVNTGPNALTIRAVDIAFNTVLSGTGALTLEPATTNQAINVGPAALTAGLDLSSTELLNLADGFASIVIGRADGNGVLTIGTISVPASAPTFRDPLTLREPVIGGSIIVNVSPVLIGNASLRFVGSGSTTILNAPLTTNGAPITFDDAVLVNAAGISISTNGGGVAAGSTITFNFPLNASNPVFGLTLNAGTNGFTIFNSSVGATGPLGALITDAGGTTILAGPSVNAASIAFNDSVLAATSTSIVASSGVLFGQTLNALSATTPNLSISAGGAIVFAGAVGAVTPLNSLTTGAGGSTTLAGGSARTTGALTFNNPLSLPVNTTLTAGSIALLGNVTGSVVNLTLNASGNTGIAGNVTGVAILTTDAPGTTIFSNATVTTTGDQIYNDAVFVSFSGDDPLPTFLTAATSFHFIIFGSSINAGLCNLTITADEINFGGNVSGSGSLRLQPFTLSQNILITAAEGGGPDDPFKLEIDSGDYSKIMNGFTDVTVGAEGGFGDLDAGPFDTSNDVQLVMNGSSGGQPGSVSVAGAINATDGSRIIIRGTGSTTHLFASITTNGGEIRIDDSVILEVSGVTLATNLAPTGTGGAVTITGRINSAASLLNSLSVFTRGGNVTLGGAIGQLTNGILGSLSIDTTRPTNVNPGIIFLGGGFITARNLISFLGPVTLTGPLTIATTGGPSAIVNFIGGINGNQNLTIAPGTGNVTFSGGGVGSTTSLTSITVNPGGSRIFTGAVTSQTLTIFGGTVEFNAPATIGSGVFISGTLQGSGDVTFTQPLTWIGGDMRGTGRTIIGPTGSLVIAGAGVKRAFRTIDSSGVVFWTDGDVQFASTGGGAPVGSFINRGTFYMQSPGHFIGTAANASFSNLGFIERSGPGASSLTDLVITSAGQIAVTDGTLNLTPRSGLFTNQGTLDLASAGTLAITGSFAQVPDAQLFTVLAGPGAGQAGRITVTGTAALAGQLTVALAPGFVPTIGTSFDVVSASSIIGTFATVFLPPNSASSRVALSYPGNAARLSVLDLADFNGDGVVDPDDLADFISAYFSTPPGLGTDFNGDGNVDPDDLADFITAFFT